MERQGELSTKWGNSGLAIKLAVLPTPSGAVADLLYMALVLSPLKELVGAGVQTFGNDEEERDLLRILLQRLMPL